MLRALLRLTLIIGLIFAGFAAISTPNLRAQELVLGETSVLVPANGQTSLQFETYCLDFGKTFPAQIGKPLHRADDEVLRVLKVALEGGYTESDPLQVQLAIWHVIEEKWVFDEGEIPHTLASEILIAAETADVTPLEGDGIPVTQAVDDGLVTLASEDFQAIDAPNAAGYEFAYRGQGTLVITNLTNEDIRIFFPFGTVFVRGLASEQNVVAYATELTLLPTATPLPTVVPTAIPTDTPTAVPTDTPTAIPTDTPMPTPTETPVAPEILPVTGASSPPDASGNSLPLLATLLAAGLFAGGWFLWTRNKPVR